MTIINATQYLKQLLSSSELNRIGKFTGFCQRLRDIQPARLLPALLSGLGCDKVDGIAGLHRHFNALQLHDTDQIAYKPFHNQLRKQGKITKPRDFKGLRKRSFFEMTFVEA